MVDETIVNEIQITGLDKATKDLQDFGDQGELAFNKVTAAAAGGFAGIGDQAARTFGRLGQATGNISSAAAGFTDLNLAVKNTRASLQQFLPNTVQTASVMQRLAASFSGVIAGLTGTSKAASETGAAMTGASSATRSFGITLRQVGRATGEAALSRLGRTVAILGKSFAVAAPAIVGFGLEKIAAGATTAAGNMADLAAQLKIGTADFARFSSLSSATGVSSDKLGDSLKAVNQLIKDTADGDAKAAEAQSNFTNQMNDSRDAIREAEKGFKTLRTENTDLNVALSEGKITIEEFNKGIKDNNDKRKELVRNIDKLVEQERRLEEQQKRTREEADRNATALQKLGISVLAANGKLKKAPEALNDIADALKQLGPGLERDQVELDLIAAGLDRRLIPALRQGAAGFQEIQDTSAKIKPGFTPEQIAIADKFAIAVQGAADAWDNLVNQLGIAIAPQFTQFFQIAQQIITQITPGIVEFGKALASVVVPILTGLGVVLNTLVIPAIQFLFGLLDQLATLINDTFGTQTTGMQLFVGVLLAIGVAFGSVLSVVVIVTAGIGLLIKALQDSGVTFQSVKQSAIDTWNTVVQGVTDAVKFITDQFTELLAFFTDLWAQLAALPQAVWDFITQGAENAANFVEQTFNDAIDAVIGFWNDLRDTVLGVWDRIKNIWAKVTGGSPTDQGGDITTVTATGLAAGGAIRGRGTTTSDSIPIWASHGEFMQPAKAVQKYGMAFMEAIRTLRFDPSALQYALGGSVMMPRSLPKLRFAEGGLVQSHGNTLNLTIGSEHFGGLRVEDKTMERLTRFANNQQLRAGSRKPAWFR